VGWVFAKFGDFAVAESEPVRPIVSVCSAGGLDGPSLITDLYSHAFFDGTFDRTLVRLPQQGYLPYRSSRRTVAGLKLNLFQPPLQVELSLP